VRQAGVAHATFAIHFWFFPTWLCAWLLFNGVLMRSQTLSVGCFRAKLSIESGPPSGVSKSTGLTAPDRRGIACQRKMVSDDIGRRSSDANRRVHCSSCRHTLGCAAAVRVQSFRLPQLVLPPWCVNTELEFKQPIASYSLPVR